MLLKELKEKSMTVVVAIDESAEMAWVYTKPAMSNTEMEGNFWDFHPGTHGIGKFGDFKGPNDFAEKIKEYYENKGYKVVIKNKKYKYE